MSTYPPGHLYLSKERTAPHSSNDYYLSADVKTVYKMDMNSGTKALKFLDGPQTYKLTQSTAYHTFIFETFKAKTDV